jgi:UDP-N-acetyl-D-mannosaminuronate dehydrogenase
MRNLVIGQGQIGVPLAYTLRARWITFERDVSSTDTPSEIDVLHICYPWDRWFISNTRKYAKEYAPRLTIIHSTVLPGATGSLEHCAPGLFVYSPVRGRHGQMDADLKRYTKFIAGNERGIKIATQILEGAGMTVGVFPSTEALELAKLLETSYSGLLIAWAQEMDRYSQEIGAEYLDVMRFMAEIGYLPRVAFQPGHIGGHCIMENLGLLEQQHRSPFIAAIRASNERTIDTGERLRPVPLD